MEPNTIQPQDHTEPQAASVTPMVVSSENMQPGSAAMPVMSASDMSAQLAAVADTPQKSKSHHGVLIGAGLVVALALFVGGYFANYSVAAVSQKNASKQAQAFVSALNAGDNARAYTFASGNLRSQQSASQFSTSMANLKASNPIVTQKSIAFNGRSATYIVTEDGLPATEDGNTAGTFDVSLVKDGLTGWKVDSVTVN